VSNTGNVKSDNGPATAAEIVRGLGSGLWFPALFLFGFLLCYMMSFHNPAPRDLRVAVAGPAVAAQVSQGLHKQDPGAFTISPAADAAAAREQVTSRYAVAAYAVTGPRAATLYVAGANGYEVRAVVAEVFAKVAAAGGQSLATVDLAPLASGDATGTGLFYMAMVAGLVPYITVMMMLRVTVLGRRGRLVTFAAAGAVISVVSFLIALALDIIPGRPLAILYGFLITQAVCWVAYGLAPFVRQFLPGVAIGLFVLLSIPSSGGAIPFQMVPLLFRWLHPVMPLGNVIDAYRGIFYFGDRGLLRPTLVLLAWMLAGAALIVAGVLRQRRKEARASAADIALEEAVTAPPEDPSVEAPLPHGARPGNDRHFGEQRPMLAGTVTGQDGSPVPGALVTVLADGGYQLTRTLTDHDGRYAVTGLPEDLVTLVLLARGSKPVAVRILPRSGHTVRRDFILEPRDTP
jgi:Carboxypeptidase regulatory-like domain